MEKKKKEEDDAKAMIPRLEQNGSFEKNINKKGAGTDAPRSSRKGTRGGGVVFAFLLFSMGGPETTIEMVLWELHQKSTPKTPNPSDLQHILPVSGTTQGLKTPILIVFSEGQKMGFN